VLRRRLDGGQQLVLKNAAQALPCEAMNFTPSVPGALPSGVLERLAAIQLVPADSTTLFWPCEIGPVADIRTWTAR
jgi:hypothetical protein